MAVFGSRRNSHSILGNFFLNFIQLNLANNPILRSLFFSPNSFYLLHLSYVLQLMTFMINLIFFCNEKSKLKLVVCAFTIVRIRLKTNITHKINCELDWRNKMSPRIQSLNLWIYTLLFLQKCTYPKTSKAQLTMSMMPMMP